MKKTNEAIDPVLHPISEKEARCILEASASLPNSHRLRVLVAIASFGKKNLEFLSEIIRGYRSMALDVDLVVNSEAPKHLDPGVKVIVGLPDRNPHSLPFAHKQIFAENLERYDLFVYSEDDIEVKEEGIRSFVRVTAELEPDEIAGHVRYEIGQGGTIYLPDVHGPFHWKQESMRHRGNHTVAEFTNEHAGFYILTQAQLRRAIASGGYLRGPYEGRYGMLETAATDPFTCCGFRKVICVSELENFLIHHMPNRYIGIMGITLDHFKEQIQTLQLIHDGTCRATRLCEVEPKVLQRNWPKSYYENPPQELLRMLPRDVATVLSVGCGWGATEFELMRRGAHVTAVPLDSVIGATVASQGIEVVSGTLSECSRSINGRKFDIVLISNFLHLLPDPWSVLREYAEHVKSGGVLFVTGYNLNFLPQLLKRQLGIGDYQLLRDFNQGGVHVHGVTTVKRQLMRVGFKIEDLRWFDLFPPSSFLRIRRWLGHLAKRNWLIKARKSI